MLKKTRLATSLGVLVAATGTAAAQPPEEPNREPTTREGSRTSVTALFGTDVGLDFAAGIQVELPIRLRIAGTIGWTPRAYAWAVGTAYEDLNDGIDAVSDVLEDLLTGAFVARLDLGFRPFPRHGMFVAAGGTVQTVSKNSVLASGIEQATGRELPGDASEMPRRFSTDVDQYLLDARLGWQWGLGSGFSLQAAVGVMVVVHSSMTFQPLYMPTDSSMTDGFVEAAETRLEEQAIGMIAPEANLFLGYTF